MALELRIIEPCLEVSGPFFVIVIAVGRGTILRTHSHCASGTLSRCYGPHSVIKARERVKSIYLEFCIKGHLVRLNSLESFGLRTGLGRPQSLPAKAVRFTFGFWGIWSVWDATETPRPPRGFGNVARNASLTGAFSVPHCPCVGSGLEGAITDCVAEASVRSHIAIQVIGRRSYSKKKKMSERKRRRCCGIQTPGFFSVRETSSWSATNKTGIYHSHLCCSVAARIALVNGMTLLRRHEVEIEEPQMRTG